MILSTGTRLGPYEVLSRLGAGAMGEVWRARDARLGRDVAIKVLSSELSTDAGRRKRFEKEARSASALNHPNIVTIYDIGSSDSVSYIAMELVKGKTLRELVFAGPLPVKRVVSIAAQIAEGLARAHDAGIIHGDLKPENVMVTRDGRAKILDFGLTTLTPTDAGVSPGTVGYRSPEQASGQPVDFRSDQFSFGSILYEMSTGRRAFQKTTDAETTSAITRDESDAVGTIDPQVPGPLRWIIERCVAEDPEGRYASTKDLARELADLQSHLLDASSASGPLRGAFAGRRQVVLALSLAFALIAFGTVIVWKRARSAPIAAPSLRFSQVTFDDQAIVKARFAPDGDTFVYGAYRLVEREARPADLFMARVGSPESRPLGIPEARICSISAGGQMAFLVGGGDAPSGTLVEAALTGGAPRALLENARDADWAPDGKTLAVVRAVEGRDRLEFPAGKVLHESPGTLLLRGSIDDCRVSPKGNPVAFYDREAGELSLVDDHGKLTRLLQSNAWGDFAWSPQGDEVWYAKFEAGATELHAVTPAGRDRLLTSLPGDFRLHDVSRRGRILLEKWTQQLKVFARLRGDAVERDLAYRSATDPVDLSTDGSRLLFNEVESSWTSSTVYLREAGKPPVPLGRGFARALSPDGKWVIASITFPGSELLLVPTHAGETRRLPKGDLKAIGLANWLPGGSRIVFAASAAGERSRLYVQAVTGGLPKAITPEGVTFFWRGGSLVSPDGRFVVGWNTQPQPISPTVPGFALYGLDGGDPRPVRGLVPREFPVQWSADGRLIVARPTAWMTPDENRRVFLLDPSSGEREPSIELSPPPLAPPLFLRRVVVARDGKSYVRVAERYSSNLFVLDGVQ